MYAPAVKTARSVKRYEWDQYEGAFLDQIFAEGQIEYEYIIVVFQKGARDPFLFISSERNARFAEQQPILVEELDDDILNDLLADNVGESHFLCIFDQQGHHNLGDANQWGDLQAFETAALQILETRLQSKPRVVQDSSKP